MILLWPQHHCIELIIFFGVPQGSILGTILFNIFINDLFLFIQETEICNFADDNTLFACDISLRNVLSRLNKDALAVNKWFETNSMVVNPEKFQVMFLGNLDPTSVYITLDNNVNIYGKTEVELLGITIDYKLTFKSHIKRLCRSANNKISALIRFRNLITFDQTRVLINAYILSYFFYCPLIWMEKQNICL